MDERDDFPDTAGSPDNPDAVGLDWRWHALFSVPDGAQREWRAQLADAQRAEQKALLAYWAQRGAAPQAG